MRYVFYHAETGTLHREVKHLPASLLEQNTPPGHIALQHDAAHPQSHRFNLASGALEEWQSAPPSGQHEWDTAKKRWQLVTAERWQMHQQIAVLEQRAAQVIRDFLLGRGGLDRLRALDSDIAALRQRTEPK